MATSTPVRHAWRALIGLIAIVAIFFGINALGVYVFKDSSGNPASSWAPQLGLDLQGGTQIILKANTESGEPSADQMAQAVTIIRQRVDASGVGEADVTTEGGTNIVVSIPGTADADMRNRIEASAQMELRPVLLTTSSSTSSIGEDGIPTPNPSDTTLSNTPSIAPTNGSDQNWITEELYAQFLAYQCGSTVDATKLPTDEPIVTCDTSGTEKFILGPVELTGDQISNATSGVNSQTGANVVQITFNKEGTAAFAEVSKRLYSLTDPTNRFAFVLDGDVISAPTMNGIITDGRPEISGSFTADTAKDLADQLKFGALPLSFTVQSDNEISATLGSQQLQIGLIAALIGLALVALYSLISYRALGFVIIASLAVMAVITYILVAVLAWRMGFRLSLAGIAGLIVTIGFTADSFIVYFERIRDELRDGKSVTAAVEDGWDRAKRTIYISKSINILCAVVLYLLADATVKGFAFTLGLTTVIDVLIFVLFTHPVMQLLARTRFFGGGHVLSGMNAQALGAVYAGRAQFVVAAPVASRGKAAKAGRSRGEAERRQTIAERKLAEAQNARQTGTTTTEEND